MNKDHAITIKCLECSGTGEYEINIDGMDCPAECMFCERSGYQNVTNEEIKKDIQRFRNLAITPASSQLKNKMADLLKLVEHRRALTVQRQKTQWAIERALDIKQDRRDHYSNNY